MRRCNDRAAADIFAHMNPLYSPTTPSQLRRCDLHGLHIKEAERYATSHINSCRKAGVGRTTFITGWGKHSADGVARLRPAIAELLREDMKLAVKVGDSDKGSITVRIIDVGDDDDLCCEVP